MRVGDDAAHRLGREVLVGGDRFAGGRVDGLQCHGRVSSQAAVRRRRMVPKATPFASTPSDVRTAMMTTTLPTTSARAAKWRARCAPHCRSTVVAGTRSTSTDSGESADGGERCHQITELEQVFVAGSYR
jgi:hypothetical protein